ncbi:adenylyl-sulfate kinase, partial [bacterium]|nr:adenylyl-sulfate kinase [bacterium]MBU1025793.1 adenylyl-sulfate kinase [bacterium]
PDFTGISAPYEPPENPALRVQTAKLDPQESVDAIIQMLKNKGILQE